MNRQDIKTSREAGNVEIASINLANNIARWTGKENRLDTLIPSLTFHRWEVPTEPTSYILEPSLCLIAQGRKQVLLGEEIYTYDARHYLITSVGLPVIAQIIEASSEMPYLGLTLELDRRVIAQLMLDSNHSSPRTREASRGMAVSEVSLQLLNAFRRLIDLLDEPDNIPVLAPLIKREIFYRLLTGEQGARLRQIITTGSESHLVDKVIELMKSNFNTKIRVDKLASYAGMSTSTFHHHFREVTAMSPLQFQKRLRLNEARRLMLMDNIDAANAAFQVGYESPSQFSREYGRLFGAPPLQDIRSLQQVSATENM